MHQQVIGFCTFIYENFKEYFENKIAHEIGSGDINGNIQYLFKNCTITGNDVFNSPNTTIISKTSELPFDNASFDTIFSTECFEHDPEFELSIKKIIHLLKDNGLFFFTCASEGRPEHGTRRTSPGDSYGAIGNIEGWADHYKNIKFDDFKEVCDINIFTNYQSYYNSETKDLYFWGIKNGSNVDIKIFNYPYVTLIENK